MHTGAERARALAVLGLGRDASVADVETAHRRLALRYHPDRTGTPGSTARFAAIVEARRILQSPTPSTPEPPPRPGPPEPPPRTARVDGPSIVAGPVRYTPAPGTNR